jgi:hypothetical protein
MAASGAIQPAYLHRKQGKLYYDIALPTLSQDLALDANGVPDPTQNPNAVFIGATDAGYEFSAEPTFYEEMVDEEDSAIEVGVESIAAQISFRALEVTDFERIAEMVPHGTYSENVVSTTTTQRITGGGDRLILPARPVAVVSPMKGGGFIGVILYAAYNSSPHALQFKRTERAGMDMVIKGLAVPGRTAGDTVYRTFKVLPAA